MGSQTMSLTMPSEGIRKTLSTIDKILYVALAILGLISVYSRFIYTGLNSQSVSRFILGFFSV